MTIKLFYVLSLLDKTMKLVCTLFLDVMDFSKSLLLPLLGLYMYVKAF